MKIISVNVSQVRIVEINGKPVETGIYKEPTSERIMLREINLDGDQQADLQAHGGIYKAAYVYPFEHYAFWQEKLDRNDFTYGQFGENFTVEGMLETDVHVGDIFKIGQDAVVQVTQPRVPCFKLEHKIGVRGFTKAFLRSNFSGFYLRVLQAGEVGAGDSIELVEADPQEMSVATINHLLYFDQDNLPLLEKAAQIEGMSPGWRDSFDAILNDIQP